MSNDTINVPRELLERIANTSVTEYETIGNQKRELRALLQSPAQPAQVQEAVTWDMVKHAIAAFNPSTSIFDAMHAALTAALAAAPKPPAQKCTCKIASVHNTAAVRKGYEMGGYVLEKCAACLAVPNPPVQEPVAWVVTGFMGKKRTRKAFFTNEAEAAVQQRNWLPHYGRVETHKLYAAPQPSEDVAKDAARYRFVRKLENDCWMLNTLQCVSEAELDAAIDDAMGQGGSDE